MPGLASSFDPGAATRAQLTAIGGQVQNFGSLRERAFAAIDNAPQRQRREVGKAASLAVQNKFGDAQTGALRSGDVVTNALRRAKARVGIINRGDAAARNQQLADRLAQVRAGIASQGRAIQTQTTGQNIAAGVNIASDAARARGDAAVAGTVGSVAGGLAATLKENKAQGRGLFGFKLGG